jgi:hypothetical protein
VTVTKRGAGTEIRTVDENISTEIKIENIVVTIIINRPPLLELPLL